MKIIFTTLFIFVFNIGFSASPSGSEITYRCIGGLKYEIIVAYYRDCRGMPYNNLQYKITNDSITINRTPKRNRIEELKLPHCTAKCNPPNQISSQGYEKHFYIDTIDFSQNDFLGFGTKSRQNVYFSYENCCRNNSVNTFNPGNFYVDAMLNVYYIRTYNTELSSPQKYNHFPITIPYMQTFSYNMSAKPAYIDDSLSYQLDRPMNSKNSYESYFINNPFTANCGNPNITNCNSNLNSKPARGFYFDSKSGNMTFTPSKSEVSFIVFRTNIYRKINQQMTLVGYSKLDIISIIYTIQENAPVLSNNTDFTIKAREQFCRNIEIKDIQSSSQLKPDSILLKINIQPQYGSLNIFDSANNIKIIRYCWTPSIEDYSTKKEDNFLFTAIENKCFLPFYSGLSKSFNIKLIAPDSLCKVKIKTYFDKNKNGVKDINEFYQSNAFIIHNSGSKEIRQTNQSGEIEINPFKGKYVFSVFETNQIYPTSSDIELNTKFDSTYIIELPFYRRTGITGRIYQDLNVKCKVDIADLPLPNIKVIDTVSGSFAFTDHQGNFFLEIPSNNYHLKIQPNSTYFSNCIQGYKGLVSLDSILKGFDFLLSVDNSKNDLSITQKSIYHHKNNQQYLIELSIQNHGNQIHYNVPLNIQTSKKLFGFNYSKSFTQNDKTIEIIIDTLLPFQKKAIFYTHFLQRDSIFKNEILCYENELLIQDTDINNNKFALCENVYDTFCCQTNIKTNSKPIITELEPNVKFKISFFNSQANTLVYLLKNSIDSSMFDINSFKIIENPYGLKISLIGQTLFAEKVGEISTSFKEIVLVFEIKVKNKIDSYFEVFNQATWKINDVINFNTTKAVVKTQPALKLMSFTPQQVCQNESVTLLIQNQYNPLPNNRYIFLLSDNNGLFVNPTTLLDTQLNSPINQLIFNIKKNILPGKYKVKIMGTNPTVSAFEEDILDTLTILKKPDQEILDNSNNNQICIDDTLKLNTQGADLYQWSFQFQPFHNFNSNSNYQFVPNNSGYVTLKAKNLNGCEALNVEKYIYVNPKPKLELTSNKPSYCENDSIVVSLSGAQSYDIYTINGDILNYRFNKYKLKSNKNEERLKIKGFNQFQCFDIDSISWKVNLLPPKPVITQISNILYSNYTNNNHWYFENDKIDFAINNAQTPLWEGIYKVSHQDSNQCISFSNNHMFKRTNIYNINLDFKIKVYPNPTHHYIYIDNEMNQVFKLDLVNMNGKAIKTIEVALGINLFDINDLPSGIYFLKGIIDGKMASMMVSILDY
jgi:hypothetical protein